MHLMTGQRARLETKKRSIAQYTLLFIAFTVTCILAIYFRTYALREPSLGELHAIEEQAKKIVIEKIRAQIDESITRQYPQLIDAAKQQFADEQLQNALTVDRSSFENVVRNTVESVRAVRYPHYSRHYLLEADPYYYYGLTERILNWGKQPHQSGLFYNTLRRAPFGDYDAVSLHPYLGIFLYRIFSAFSKMDLMEALGWLPVVLCVVIAGLSFYFFSILGVSLWAAWIGSLTILLSPIFIQRSAFGWYDTDPYNYIFPLLILSFFFKGQPRSGKPFWIYAALCGFATGLYSLFWPGWPYIFVLVTGAGFAQTVFDLFVLHKNLKSSTLRFTLSYLLFSLLFLILILQPLAFWRAFEKGWNFLSRLGRPAEVNLWPSAFLTVGEAVSISPKKLIFLTGNYITTLLAFVGLAGEGLSAWFDKNKTRFSRWLALVCISIPLLIMSLQTERFAVLFVLPVAIFAAFGTELIYSGLLSCSGKLTGEKTPRLFLSTVIVCLIFILFTPMTFVTAHVVATGIRPIMDDAWYDALTVLRDKTPENSIIHSWWPPGHFITAIAHRRVSVDGGSQHLPETYWISKALLVEDERETAGLLRMVNSGGNGAVEHLQSLGKRLPEIYDLLMQIAPLNWDDAMQKLPVDLNMEQKRQLLGLTHGLHASPPTYVFLYNDLVEQNLALSLMAGWDFKKAEEILSAPKGLDSNRKIDPLQKIISISGDILKFTPESPLIKRDGERLFFQNGVSVDLTTMEADVSKPEINLNGKPYSFIYMKDGELIEKSYSGERIEGSALLFERNGAYYAILADRRLLRSILFRLYYLRGEGLKLFKPFISKEDDQTQTKIYVYELDWNAFDPLRNGG